MHVAICFACTLAVAVIAHQIGRLELANSKQYSHTKCRKELQLQKQAKMN